MWRDQQPLQGLMLARMHGLGSAAKGPPCTAVRNAGKDGQLVPSKYDLVANILHDGKAGEGTYRAHIHRKSEDAWCAHFALLDASTCVWSRMLSCASLQPLYPST